jgi:hypothetical protein
LSKRPYIFFVVGNIEDREWQGLLSDHEHFQAAERNYAQSLAAMLSVLIVVSGAIALSLEKLSATTSGPSKVGETGVPDWAWVFVPLPLLGIFALFVHLQTEALHRDRQLALIRRRMADLLEKPYHRRTIGRRGRIHLILLSRIAILSNVAVAVALSTICIWLTKPLWLQIAAGLLELLAFTIVGWIFAENSMATREG